MRDILKRIFIGVAVGMALFFLKSEVFAASISPTSTQYDARYSSYSCSLGVCSYDSWGAWQGTVNMGTAILQPDSDWTGLTQLSLKYNYNSGFVAGNTYTFKVRVNISNSAPVSVYAHQWLLTGVRGGTTVSNLDYTNILSSTLQRIELDSDNDKVFYIYVSVTPAVNVNYIWMYVGGRVVGTSDQLDNGNVVVRNGGVTYTEGTNSYIQQTTNAVIELTQTLISTNQELLDADAPASKDFNNDYSTQAYDQAHDSLHDYFVDNSGNTFTIDFTQWHNVFAWLFAKLTQFVQLNAKVFAMITGYLTFSFVGLVFNR